MRTLSIAIASSIFGTSLVVPTLASIFLHFDEIQSSIETARHLGYINIKSELSVLKLEHLIVLVIRHQETSGTNILGVRTAGNKADIQAGSSTADAISAAPCALINPIKGALARTGRVVGAQAMIPGVAGVAICVPADVVSPSPIGVHGDLGVLTPASSRLSAGLHGHWQVEFLLLVTDLLGT